MSSFLLKIIALIAMTIDHIGYAFFPSNFIWRIIGRIAMPIFAFQVAIGFRKTSSKIKYIFRMLICAIISQIPFSLLTASSHYSPGQSFWQCFKDVITNNFNLNICFTFFIALATLLCIEESKKHKVFILGAIYCVLVSVLIPMDYEWFGVAMVLVFYYFQDYPFIYTPLTTLILSSYCILYGNSYFIQFSQLLAFPFLFFFNQKKGPSLKYLFYAFYPLHMIIISLIKVLL